MLKTLKLKKKFNVKHVTKIKKAFVNVEQKMCSQYGPTHCAKLNAHQKITNEKCLWTSFATKINKLRISSHTALFKHQRNLLPLAAYSYSCNYSSTLFLMLEK